MGTDRGRIATHSLRGKYNLACMLVHFGPDLLQPEWEHSVVCIGTFDGVHIGHRALITEAVKEARSREWPPILVTFDRHPAATLAPDRKPLPIGTLEQNAIKFRKLGIAICLILPFTNELAHCPADQFLQEILIGKLRMGHAVVGHDFAFGHNRTGTSEWLQERIPTTILPPVLVDGERVSSTLIRQAILAGDMERVENLSGEPFALKGVVVPGQKLGRTIGFPTVNLARSSDQIVPADGIYAGYCEIEGVKHLAAISVGNRPAVGGTERTIEANLIDFPQQELYGYPIELSFIKRVRPELDFPHLDELRKQIDQDVRQIREILTKPLNSPLT